jgi:hypothetical protein
LDASAYVLLDDVGRADVRFARISTCFARRPALAEQIPTLVEFDLDRGKPLGFGRVQRSLVEQTMLFDDELLNVAEYPHFVCLICHANSPLIQKDRQQCEPERIFASGT